jgi:hypothetical protein
MSIDFQVFIKPDEYPHVIQLHNVNFLNVIQIELIFSDDSKHFPLPVCWNPLNFTFSSRFSAISFRRMEQKSLDFVSLLKIPNGEPLVISSASFFRFFQFFIGYLSLHRCGPLEATLSNKSRFPCALLFNQIVISISVMKEAIITNLDSVCLGKTNCQTDCDRFYWSFFKRKQLQYSALRRLFFL